MRNKVSAVYAQVLSVLHNSKILVSELVHFDITCSQSSLSLSGSSLILPSLESFLCIVFLFLVARIDQNVGIYMCGVPIMRVRVRVRACVGMCVWKSYGWQVSLVFALLLGSGSGW
jgi:hypothetical protein